MIWAVHIYIVACGAALLLYIRLYEPINSLMLDCVLVGFAVACTGYCWESMGDSAKPIDHATIDVQRRQAGR